MCNRIDGLDHRLCERTAAIKIRHVNQVHCDDCYFKRCNHNSMTYVGYGYRSYTENLSVLSYALHLGNLYLKYIDLHMASLDENPEKLIKTKKK